MPARSYRDRLGLAYHKHLAARGISTVVDFVATGGSHAQAQCDRYARRLRKTRKKKWRVSRPRIGPAIPHECRRRRQTRRSTSSAIERPPGDSAAAHQQARGVIFRRAARAGQHLRLAPDDDVRRPRASTRTPAPACEKRTDPKARVPFLQRWQVPALDVPGNNVPDIRSPAWDQCCEPVHEWLRIREWRSMS